MTVVTTEQTPCSADSPTARRPPSSRCRKHAFARFSSNVGLGTQFPGCSPRSRHVSYDLHRSLSVDCSVGRYYDSQTGQFLSVDPMVEQTQQAYIYVGDDPVNGIDPEGTCSSGSQGYAQCGDPDIVGYNVWRICERENQAGIVGHGRHLFSFIVRIARSAWANRVRILSGTLFVGGLAAAVVCTIATDGLCAVAIADIPVGELTEGVVYGAVTNTAVYALSNARHSLGGYFTAAAKGADLGILSSAIPSIIGIEFPAGEHAVPVKFFGVIKALFSTR
jgi:RHS repeat-associated protein